MIEAGDAAGLAQRVPHPGVKLAESKPFGKMLKSTLLSRFKHQNVFFPCSSADIESPDMHQHFPNNNQEIPENATSY
jgi:hypothetical protein